MNTSIDRVALRRVTGWRFVAGAAAFAVAATRLNVHATPLEQALAETLASYRRTEFR
jgi:hypothetical protein